MLTIGMGSNPVFLGLILFNIYNGLSALISQYWLVNFIVNSAICIAMSEIYNSVYFGGLIKMIKKIKSVSIWGYEELE